MMKKPAIFRFSIFILFILISCRSEKPKSQDAKEVFAYFDKFWKEVSGPEKATFYRVVAPQGKKFLVRDYYMSGHLQMEELVDNVRPKLIWEGPATLFYENGKVHEKGIFRNEERIGLHHYWYPDGKRQKDIYYDVHDQVYQAYWSPSGISLLDHGNGTVHDINEFRDDYLEIKDSTVVASYRIETAKDTVYSKTEEMPSYKGGHGQWLKEVEAHIKRPATLSAKEEVLLSFVVTASGQPEQAYIEKGFSPKLDTEALRLIKSLNHWNPGKHKGHPIKARIRMPVIF